MYNQFPYSSFNPVGSSVGQLGNTSRLGGLLGLGKGAFNWDGFLNNAQRTLNVINQAIPVYNQVKPVFKNVGTVFRVIGELSKSNNTSSSKEKGVQTKETTTTNGPQFFA
jgi:hypothetical protein